MWLIPSGCSEPSPVSEDSKLPPPAGSPEWAASIASSAWWRGKRSAAPVWSRRWNAVTWLRALFGAVTYETSPLPPSIERWISSWAASPAKTCPAPGRWPGSPAHGPASSSPLSGSLATWDRATSSWRMSEASPPGPSRRRRSASSSARWPKAGGMRSGCIFARPTLALPTDASDGSAWPTATAMDCRGSGAAAYSTESGRHSGTTLTDAARDWPTASATDHKGSSQPGQRRGQLTEAVLDWLTATANCVTGAGTQGRDGGENLQTAVDAFPLGRPDPTTSTGGAVSSPSGPTSRRRLNPRFVAWLMGFPCGWTQPCDTESINSAPSETPSSPSRAPSPSPSCGAGSTVDADVSACLGCGVTGAEPLCGVCLAV